MATNQMRREAAKRKLERQQQRRAEQSKRRQRVAIITSASVVVVVVVAVVLLSTLSGGGTTTPEAAPTTAPPTSAAPVTPVVPAAIPSEIAPLPKRPTPLPASVTCDYAADAQSAAKPVQPPSGTGVSTTGTATVTLQTNSGAIPLTLDKALAPCTVNSVVSLAQQGYFDGSNCHRLTTDPGLQVLQCGDPTGSGSGGPGYTVPDEIFPELTYGRGILAMANTGRPNSGGSQFFIVYGDGTALGPQYTVFGSVGPEGLSVVDAIATRGHNGAFDPRPGSGEPIEPVTIEKATVS